MAIACMLLADEIAVTLLRQSKWPQIVQCKVQYLQSASMWILLSACYQQVLELGCKVPDPF